MAPYLNTGLARDKAINTILADDKLVEARTHMKAALRILGETHSGTLASTKHLSDIRIALTHAIRLIDSALK